MDSLIALTKAIPTGRQRRERRGRALKRNNFSSLNSLPLFEDFTFELCEFDLIGLDKDA